MGRHIVGTVGEIPAGGRKIVAIAGIELGIFNIDGRYYAIRNVCPHRGAPLCLGRITGKVTGDVGGSYRYDDPGTIIRCPWHGWEFDITTGESWCEPAEVRTKTYPVHVGEDEVTEVEHYDVSVSDPYLFVDLPDRLSARVAA